MRWFLITSEHFNSGIKVCHICKQGNIISQGTGSSKTFWNRPEVTHFWMLKHKWKNKAHSDCSKETHLEAISVCSQLSRREVPPSLKYRSVVPAFYTGLRIKSQAISLEQMTGQELAALRNDSNSGEHLSAFLSCSLSLSPSPGTFSPSFSPSALLCREACPAVSALSVAQFIMPAFLFTCGSFGPNDQCFLQLQPCY